LVYTYNKDTNNKIDYNEIQSKKEINNIGKLITKKVNCDQIVNVENLVNNFKKRLDDMYNTTNSNLDKF